MLRLARVRQPFSMLLARSLERLRRYSLRVSLQESHSDLTAGAGHLPQIPAVRLFARHCLSYVLRPVRIRRLGWFNVWLIRVASCCFGFSYFNIQVMEPLVINDPKCLGGGIKKIVM